eukprot:TRINITY_DN6110_c0_g1_i1.p1 TRINITY_DN6110_c0_g1~~TRINITY_DN6110_c0_g1_i1.p1  ORF type:complete len:145 (+),score=57.44 TRINITY_DN6110_c0_g1_i1:111-545(+)
MQSKDKIDAANVIKSQLIQAEQIAAEILYHQNEILEIDKKRNKNREALTTIRNSNYKQEKIWYFSKNQFFQIQTSTIIKKLEIEQLSLTNQIDIQRNQSKTKTIELYEVEGRSTQNVKGFLLKPTKPSELELFSQKIQQITKSS